jgi:hypothetical protein
MTYTCVKYQGETPLDSQYALLKMKDRMVRKVLFRRGASGRSKGKQRRGTGSVYFICVREKINDPAGIVLKREGGRMMEGMNLIKIYRKHTCEFHNVYPLYN